MSHLKNNNVVDICNNVFSLGSPQQRWF